MPVADGKIKLTSTATGQTVEISLPVYPYKTRIELPFTIRKLEDGSGYSIYDEGATYDVRTCTADFILSATEQKNFNNFIQLVAEGRNQTTALELSVCTSSQFRPFGPDKNDTLYNVTMEVISSGGWVDNPYGHFKNTVRFTALTPYAGGALPSQVADGPAGVFQIGTVADLRFPPQLFNPVVKYKVSQFVLRDSSAVKVIDGTIYGDQYDTSFDFATNFSKAAALLAYLTGTARGGTFTIAVGQNYYPFGRSKVDGDDDGSGTFTVRMIQDELEITHEYFNHFTVPLSLNFISVA